MRTCATCGIETGEPLTVTYHGSTADYCSFECAITPLAPRCQHCGCTVIGHGKYGDEGAIFCCSHCVEVARSGEPAPSSL